MQPIYLPSLARRTVLRLFDGLDRLLLLKFHGSDINAVILLAELKQCSL